MKPTEFVPETAVYDPPATADFALAAIRSMREHKHRAIKLGIDGIDGYFAPMTAGQVCAVIAQTSHYKSGFLHCIERNAALQLVAEQRDEIIVHVSLEELIEEQAFVELAAETGDTAGRLARGVYQDWERLEAAAVRIGTVPIYRIGAALARAEDMPNLYLSNIYRAIRYLANELYDKPLTIAAIYLDYLQALPLDPEHRSGHARIESRRLQVEDDVYRIFEMAAYFQCPIFVGVQAKQNLEGSQGSMLIPGIYDGQETASIAQRFSRIVQLWMPKMTHRIGTLIEYRKGAKFAVEENMLFAKVGKQRGGLPSGRTFPCRIDFVTNSVTHDPMILKGE